ncbi:MAG: TIGR03086 family protein [Bifidobacteriaceae bacterium]|jgi:uncharacterized protein (TIGR03086 family)|nr:TIGR03086 family protein [Bifidobacteriaceae bacterium]
MAETAGIKDTRPDFFEILDWTVALVKGTKDSQLTAPTPNAGWDVRQLLDHMLHVAEKLYPATPLAQPAMQPGTVYEYAARYGSDVAAVKQQWADGALLRAGRAMPTGATMTGADALLLCSQEALVHGWDLAHATGQGEEGPAGPAEATLAFSMKALPKDRPAGGPFGPVVEVPATAGPTRRLAAWTGR